MNPFRRKQDLAGMLARLDELEFGDERRRLAEDGIRAAAAQGDDNAGFAFRKDLLVNCLLEGRLERAIPAMEWCLDRCDREPDRFPVRDVVFQYKWIVEELPKHSVYTAETIERGLQDLERRFDTVGWNRRGPLGLRILVAWQMRQHEKAAELFPVWDGLPRDDGSDCPVCETALRTRFYIMEGKLEHAIEAAAKLISGDEECSEEPGRCFSRLQFAFAELDRFDEAIEVHKRSIQQVIAGPQFADARGNHLLFLLMTDNLDNACRMVEVSVPQAIEAGGDLALLQACDLGAVTCDILRRRGMDVPAFEPNSGLGLVTSDDWAQWMDSEAERLARIFDERNGNTAYMDDRTEWRALADRIAGAG